ncbi:MAG: hypothetical protein HQM14_07685 [SAR324 cluster bacterium]|nr:hypothetical protein [SAR324 cluster bacterium]
MNKYMVDGNSYFIFDQESSCHMVYFLWGKFDFRLFFRQIEQSEALAKKKLCFQDADKNYLITDKLQHLFQGEWYDFKKVTSHGFTFEETQWIHDGKVHFAEFPKEIMAVAADIASQELNLTRLE